MQISWTKIAQDDLSSILEYIAQDSPTASRDFLYQSLKKIPQLEDFPNLGRIGRVPTTKELVIHENHFIVYRGKSSNIEILRVMHVRRKFPIS